jgi:hypothetical protein
MVIDLKGELYMNQILFMQTGIANMYMKKHKLSPEEFLTLDKKFDILGFIREGYEPFHLMGDKGILSEVEEYVRTKSVRPEQK